MSGQSIHALNAGVSDHPPDPTWNGIDPMYVLDVCSGFQSMSKYYLRTFPNCKIISIDLLEGAYAMKLLTVAEQSRIHYVKENIEIFTFEKLVELLHKAWGIGVSDLTHAHWSPPCSSMSTADLGTNNYRWPDGTARPGTVAAIHDRIFNKFFGVWEQIAGAHPGLLMSVENPVGWFQHMPAVTNLLRRDHSWQLCETHYCPVLRKRSSLGTSGF